MTYAQPDEVRYDVHGERTETERVPGVDVIAAFDFDGTLTKGGSVWKWLSSLVGRTVVAQAGAALAPSLARAAVVGGEAADAAKEALFVRTLAGLDAGEVAARGVAFGQRHYHRHSRNQVRARVDWHRRQGHVLVLVSASPELYVAPVGEELGFDGVLATRLEVDPAGRLTGRFDGRNCRGSEKLRRLDEWLDDLWSGAPTPSSTRHERPFLWAYGNSAGDRQLLAAADIGVDAGRLGRLGSLRRYRRLGDVLTAW
jgi:phosphatidylglycerophosphatase C